MTGAQFVFVPDEFLATSLFSATRQLSLPDEVVKPTSAQINEMARLFLTGFLGIVETI